MKVKWGKQKSPKRIPGTVFRWISKFVGNLCRRCCFIQLKRMIKVLEFWLEIEIKSLRTLIPLSLPLPIFLFISLFVYVIPRFSIFSTFMQCVLFCTTTKTNIFMEMAEDMHWFMNIFMMKVHATKESERVSKKKIACDPASLIAWTRCFEQVSANSRITNRFDIN